MITAYKAYIYIGLIWPIAYPLFFVKHRAQQILLILSKTQMKTKIAFATYKHGPEDIPSNVMRVGLIVGIKLVGLSPKLTSRRP